MGDHRPFQITQPSFRPNRVIRQQHPAPVLIRVGRSSVHPIFAVRTLKIRGHTEDWTTARALHWTQFLFFSSNEYTLIIVTNGQGRFVGALPMDHLLYVAWLIMKIIAARI
jgi:hypothetical protein